MTKPHYDILRYDERRSPKWSLFVDQGTTPILSGDTIGVPNANAATFSPAVLAPSSTKTGHALDGFLGEMLIVDRYVNDSEVAELAPYLKDEYGIE